MENDSNNLYSSNNNSGQNKQTLIINFFAGPGAGKTTCAWEVASELKKRNIVTEYVSEYAKELVWDGRLSDLDGSYNNQMKIFKEQKRRLDRLIGKVDVIVTDSPLLLQNAYVKENAEHFEKMSVATHEGYNNFNLFINRGKNFEKEGRLQSLEESIEKDNDIKSILERNNIYYGNYYHKTTSVVAKNIQKTLKRLQSENNIKDMEDIMAESKNEIGGEFREKSTVIGELSYSGKTAEYDRFWTSDKLTSDELKADSYIQNCLLELEYDEIVINGGKVIDPKNIEKAKNAFDDTAKNISDRIKLLGERKILTMDMEDIMAKNKIEIGNGYRLNPEESYTLNEKSANINVEGHMGTWYVIDTMQDNDNNRTLYLLEHEEYGDDAACVIVDQNKNLVLSDVWNGFLDYEESLSVVPEFSEHTVHFKHNETGRIVSTESAFLINEYKNNPNFHEFGRGNIHVVSDLTATETFEKANKSVLTENLIKYALSGNSFYISKNDPLALSISFIDKNDRITDEICKINLSDYSISFNKNKETAPWFRDTIMYIRKVIDNQIKMAEMYEKAPATDIENLSKSGYRKLAEFNGVVMAANLTTDNKIFHPQFTVWNKYADNSGGYVYETGSYCNEYDEAKEIFAKRSGLVSDNKLFNETQLKVIRSCLNYCFDNADLGECKNAAESVKYQIDNIIGEIKEDEETAFSCDDEMEV